MTAQPWRVGIDPDTGCPSALFIVQHPRDDNSGRCGDSDTSLYGQIKTWTAAAAEDSSPRKFDPQKMSWAWSFVPPGKMRFAHTSVFGQLGDDLNWSRVEKPTTAPPYQDKFDDTNVQGRVCFDGAFVVPVLADEQQKDLSAGARFVPVVPDVSELTAPEVSATKYARGLADCPNLVLNEKSSLRIEVIKNMGCDSGKSTPGSRDAGDVPVGRTSSIKFMGRFWKLHAEVLLSCTSVPSVFCPVMVNNPNAEITLDLGDISARIAAQYWFAYKYQEDMMNFKTSLGHMYITTTICQTYTERFKATYPGYKVSSRWFGIELENKLSQIDEACKEGFHEHMKKYDCKSCASKCFLDNNSQVKLRSAGCDGPAVNMYCKMLEKHGYDAYIVYDGTICLYTPQVQVEVAMGVVGALNVRAATVIDPLQFANIKSQNVTESDFLQFTEGNDLAASYKKATSPIIKLCCDFSGGVASLYRKKRVRKSYPLIEIPQLMTSFIVNNITAEMALYNLLLSDIREDSLPELTHVITDAVTGTVYAMSRTTAHQIVDSLYLSSSMDSLDMTQRYITEPCLIFIPEEPGKQGTYCNDDIVHGDTFERIALNKDLELSANIQSMVSNVKGEHGKVVIPRTWKMSLDSGKKLKLLSGSSILGKGCGNQYSTYPPEEQVVGTLVQDTGMIEFHIDLTKDRVPQLAIYNTSHSSTPALLQSAVSPGAPVCVATPGPGENLYQQMCSGANSKQTCESFNPVCAWEPGAPVCVPTPGQGEELYKQMCNGANSKQICESFNPVCAWEPAVPCATRVESSGTCATYSPNSQCSVSSFLPGLHTVAGLLQLDANDAHGKSVLVFRPENSNGGHHLELVNSHDGHLVYTTRLTSKWVSEDDKSNYIDELAIVVSPSVDYTEEYTDKSCIVMTIPTAYQQLHDDIAGPLDEGVFHMGVAGDTEQVRGGDTSDQLYGFRATLYILLVLSSLAIIALIILRWTRGGHERKVRLRK